MTVLKQFLSQNKTKIYAVVQFYRWFALIVCSLKAKNYPGGIIFPRPGHINFLLIPHPANKVPQAAVFSDIIKA